MQTHSSHTKHIHIMILWEISGAARCCRVAGVLPGAAGCRGAAGYLPSHRLSWSAAAGCSAGSTAGCCRVGVLPGCRGRLPGLVAGLGCRVAGGPAGLNISLG